jgi:hypothetical protein
LSWVVSDPVVGSVTPNACNRSRPAAISGRYLRFCASLPCRSSVPMMYICAWPWLATQPAALISSRITAAARNGRPLPPYSSGISAPRKPAAVSSSTNSVG